jgi:8-oxo-dGTP diphosphatase
MKSINNHIIPSDVKGFHQKEVPLLNSVDCVIFGFQNSELRVLLVKFPYEPYLGHWSLIGGFILPHIDIDKSALITVQKMTGLENVYLKQVKTFGAINRVPSERVITTCYYALINVEPTIEHLSKAHEATWFSINDLPNLVYDHKKMIEESLEKLQKQIMIEPIGYELLPEKFTMLQVQKLYESILNLKLDKRNFQKKLIGLDFFEKLEDKDTQNSKKGSFLYCFKRKA